MEPREYGIMHQVEDSHFWYRNLHAMVAEHLDDWRPNPAGPVLDVGCGSGAMLSRLREHGPAVGVDLSPDALAYCRRRGLTGTIARASAGRLPFPPGHFAAVVMMDVLYHRWVASPVQVCEEARRVLRPGGLLLLNVPAYGWLYSSHDRAVYTARRFQRREVRSILREGGFETIRCSHWNTALFPAVLATRWLRKGRGESASDLEDPPHPWTNALLYAILRGERAVMRRRPLPFGLSIFAAARRAG